MREVDESVIFHRQGDYWLRPRASVYRLGLSDWGQYCIGQIELISEWPGIGQIYRPQDIFLCLESHKATHALEMPISARIIEHNKSLISQPQLINTHCYTQGWLLTLELLQPDELDLWQSPERHREEISTLFNKR